jgi:CheW-like domain
MSSRVQPKVTGGSYIAATFDGMTLVLDQDGAEAVKDATDLGAEGFTDAANRLVVVEHEGESIPVFRLSGTFEPTDGPTRAFVLIARTGDQRIGLMCDEVRTVAAAKVRLEALPLCMQTAATLPISIAYLQDTVGFHCPAAALTQLTSANMEESHGYR